MAGLRHKPSVRQMPQGKLQRQIEMFEKRDKEASPGAKLYGISEERTPSTPTSTSTSSSLTQSRFLLSASNTPGCRKTWMAPDFATRWQDNNRPAALGSASASTARQRSTSESEPALRRVTSPSPTSSSSSRLSQRLALFSRDTGEVTRRAGSEGRESVSPDKRLSFPDTGGRDRSLSTLDDRQRALSDGSASDRITPGVLTRLKRFEDRGSESSVSARHSVNVVGSGHNMSSVSSAQRPVPKWTALVQQGDSGSGASTANNGLALTDRNFEQLKVKIKFDSSSPSSFSRQDYKPVEALISPPMKPPRTFAHDEYLQIKLQQKSAQKNQNGGVRDSEKPSDSQSSGVGEGESGGVGVKSRGGEVKEEVVLRTVTSQDGYSHLGPTAITGQRQGTPPRDLTIFSARLRPISENSALRPLPGHTTHQHTNGHTNDNSNNNNNSESNNINNDNDCTDVSEGPVVISLKSGKKLPSPPKEPGTRRNPFDKLPDTPVQKDAPLEAFALRKSHSSEFLDRDHDDHASPASPTRRASCVDHKERANHLYETLTKGDLYARPRKLLAGAEKEAGPGAKEEAEGGVSKRPLVISPSEGSFPPPLTPSTTTPVSDQDPTRVSRNKMNMVRQKINQAYEVLNTVFNEPRPGSRHGSQSGSRSGSGSGSVSEDDRSLDSVDHPEQSEGDSDSTVDVKEIKERVTYCSSVRLKTSESIKKSREFLNKIYPQLFEYALIVGLRPRQDPQTQGYDSYIIHSFPSTANIDVSVSKFCFPDADEFRPDAPVTMSESYSFMLTNMYGGRLFGYCRRIQPTDSSLPEVICIVSPVDAFNMYNKLLSEVESRRSKSLDHAQELIEASFGRPLPSPGRACNIRCLDEAGQMETLIMDRPQDQRLTNVNYESLLTHLGTDKLIKVFSCLLMERRLILCSHHLSTLTQTIHALCALLYPFHWQHVYIPLLPPDMLEVCAAPMPFIIGILHSHLHRVTALELEDVVIVDLDKKQMVRCMGDEATLLPRKVQKALKTALNMCKVDSDAVSNRWLMVSEAFLRMFLEMMGHFPRFISTQQDGQSTLMREHFISGVSSKGIRQFLEWFTETQMFEVFITTQLHLSHSSGSLDLFMTRLAEFQGKRSDSSQSKGIGRKVIKAIKHKLK